MNDDEAAPPQASGTVDRQGEIRRRFNERFLSRPEDRHAFRNDAFFYAQLNQIRQLLEATEAAMAAEGISEEARDRVAYRLLYGAEPESYAVPDFREARARMTARQTEIERLMSQPLARFKLPPDLL